MASKSAPLETFLTTVSPNVNPSEDVRKVDSDPAEGARAVILIILAKDSPLSTDALRQRSELDADLYRKTIGDLISHGFVQSGAENDFSLTADGKRAAEQQRARLLSLW
jgi:predicted transcriptional regulator